MKVILILVAFIAALDVARADFTGYDSDPGYTFTTQNGVADWGASSPTGSGVGGANNLRDFTFAINADTLYAEPPYNSTGALTEGVSTETGDSLTLEEANNYFDAIGQVSLTSITVYLRNGNDANQAPAGSKLQITDALGNVVVSESLVFTANQTLRDPWAQDHATLFWTRGTATFTFDSEAILNLNETYTVTLVDVATGTGLDITSTSNSAPGFEASLIPGNGLAGLTIVTESIIPEPSTASLSLLALVGLLGRRRRK